MRLVSIDPGACSGWARFDNGVLIECGIARTIVEKQAVWHWLFEFCDGPCSVVIEKPVIYPGDRSKDPNDLITLSIDAGQHAGAALRCGCSVAYFRPADWKGQAKKQHCHRWMRERLSEAERSIQDASGDGLADSYKHNMLDAVGIGLHALSRGFMPYVAPVKVGP